ncbi:MAG: SDR family oxidoreductase [Thermovirgaceae bacterium]
MEKKKQTRTLPSCDQRRLLSGQKALVTGASHGIGRAIAVGMGRAGASVAVNYNRSRESAEEVVQEIKKSGSRAVALRADVAREDEVVGMFSDAAAEFGGLDILVNNAGMQRDAPIDQMTLEEWEKVIDTNLTGGFLCSREAIRFFRSRIKPGEVSSANGKIIFISSVHELIPWAGHPNYAASKGGMMLLMKSLAQEVAPFGIRVNSIAPGAVRTSINRSVWEAPESLEKLLSLVPYGRIGEPEDVARAAVWLASDEADYICGTTIFVDGGMTLYPGFTENG